MQLYLAVKLHLSLFNFGQICEEFIEIKEAIHREKQLKKYLRKWKEELIERDNPEWKDIAEGWFEKKEFELFKKFDEKAGNFQSTLNDGMSSRARK